MFHFYSISCRFILYFLLESYCHSRCFSISDHDSLLYTLATSLFTNSVFTNLGTPFHLKMCSSFRCTFFPLFQLIHISRFSTFQNSLNSSLLHFPLSPCMQMKHHSTNATLLLYFLPTTIFFICIIICNYFLTLYTL